MRISRFNARIAPDVAQLGLQAVFLTMTGLCNRDGDEHFNAISSRHQNAIREEFNDERLDCDAILLGFRQLHARIGVSNRKNVASPEALLRLLLKRGSLPRVNLLVDIYNLVSIETRLSLGAHDLKKVEGDVELRLTNGSERFCPLGQTEVQTVRAGEYAYIDGSNEVLCRLEVRQAEKTKLTVDTTDCFFIIQGNPATDEACLRRGTARLVELTRQFCGGEHDIIHAPWI
jgi:DNA/RNA-binding domain of Phe-tRNA-synthetase-like protein